MIARQLLAAASFAAAASPALADVPYLTDDPALIEQGHFELAFALDHIVAPDENPTALAATFDFGITERAQVGVAALSTQADGFTVDEFAVNAKIALITPREGRLGLVLKPTFAMPLGSRVRRKAGFALPAYAGIAAGRWAIYGGGGYAFGADSDGGDFPFAGIVVSRTMSERWTVGSELNVRGQASQNPAFAELGTGASVALDDRFTLAAGVYRTLSHRGANGDGRAFLTLRYAR